jgi:hypothetical protein
MLIVILMRGICIMAQKLSTLYRSRGGQNMFTMRVTFRLSLDNIAYALYTGLLTDNNEYDDCGRLIPVLEKGITRVRALEALRNVLNNQSMPEDAWYEDTLYEYSPGIFDLVGGKAKELFPELDHEGWSMV